MTLLARVGPQHVANAQVFGMALVLVAASASGAVLTIGALAPAAVVAAPNAAGHGWPGAV